MKSLAATTKVLVASAVLAATPVLATHSWGGYHWATTGSGLTVKVNTAVTSAWTSYVGTAISDWESSRYLALTAQTTSGVNPKTCNPIAGQVLVCSAAYGQRGWLGIASIWLSNGHIVQGTTKLNDTYYAFDFYNTPAWRAAVACQEIGHDFGLDHQDEIFDNVNLGSCMDYSRNPAGGVYNGFDYGPNNEHPDKHDYDQLKIIYNHDDGYTSATASTNFGIREVGKAAPPVISSAGSGDSPAEWGRAIRYDAQGRPNVFEKDLAPGQKVLTHVFWAIGEGPKS